MKTCRRFRAYPTLEQQEALANTFGACRWVYNTMLRIRTDRYAKGETIDYHKSSAMLTGMRHAKETDWLSEVSCVPTQQALRHLQTGFQRFFDKISRYPTFKTKKKSKMTASYSRAGFRLRDGNLSLAKIGVVNVRWSRPVKALPSTVAITRTPAGRYYVTLVLEESFKKLPKTGIDVGIDLGINRLATLSNGERIANPRHLEKQLRKIARLQRSKCRRVEGSKRREKMRLKIAKVHEAIRDTRMDHLNKITTDIVRRFDRIYVEDLNVCGLMRFRKISRSTCDVAWGAFLRMLQYKSERHGRTFVRVDRFFPSSKRCSACGFVMEKLPLHIRSWTCPECETLHDRDENAAKNILAVGYTASVQGEHIRRKATMVAERKARRTAHSQKEMPSTVQLATKRRPNVR